MNLHCASHRTHTIVSCLAQFARNGRGWEEYPEIEVELTPSKEDNGMCWITKEEFFKHFPSIYLCAFNTARLKEADYVNDLEDEFPRDNPSAHAEESSESSDDSSVDISLSDSDDDISISDDEEPSTRRGAPVRRIASVRKTNGSSGELSDVSSHSAKSQEQVGGRANQVEDMKKKLAEEKKGRRVLERATSSGSQIQLMKEKLEEDRKNRAYAAPPRRTMSAGGSSKIAMMAQKFKGKEALNWSQHSTDSLK